MSPSSIDPFAKPSANARYLRIPAEDQVDVKGSLRIATMTPHVVPLAAIGLQLILLERAFLVAHRELAERAARHAERDEAISFLSEPTSHTATCRSAGPARKSAATPNPRS